MQTLDSDTFTHIAMCLDNKTLSVLEKLHKDLVETTKYIFGSKKPKN